MTSTSSNLLGQRPVLRREQRRYAKEGPRKMEVLEREYKAITEGANITVKYAYYPNVLWGVSDDIRVPW